MKKALLRSLIFLALLGFIAASGKAEAATPKLAHVDDLKDKRIGVLQGSAHVIRGENLAQGKLLNTARPRPPAGSQDRKVARR